MRQILALLAIALAAAACAGEPPTANVQPTANAATATPSTIVSPSPATPTPIVAPVIVTPAPTATPSSTPSSTPATLTRAQAAEAYKALAAAFNKAQRAADKLVPGPDTSDPNVTRLTWPVSANRRMWSAYLAAVDDFLVGFRALRFPPEAASQAEAMLKAAIAYRKRARAAYKVKTRDDTLAASNAAMFFPYYHAAQQAVTLRRALGLPPPHRLAYGIPGISDYDSF